MNNTQLKIIEDRLVDKGRVSRNWCLQNYISRLGALIHILKKEGYVIEGHFENVGRGRDFIYRLVSEPDRRKSNTEDELAEYHQEQREQSKRQTLL